MPNKISLSPEASSALKALIDRRDPQHVFGAEILPLWGFSLGVSAAAAMAAVFGFNTPALSTLNHVAWAAAVLFGAAGLFLTLRRFAFGIAPGLYVLSIGLLDVGLGGSLTLWRYGEFKASFGRQSRQTVNLGFVIQGEGLECFIPSIEEVVARWERVCRGFAQTDFMVWLSLTGTPGAAVGLPSTSGAPGATRSEGASADADRAIHDAIARNPRPDEGRRTAADAPFAQIARAMEMAGLRLVSHIEEGVVLDPKPRNPIRADYSTNGANALYLRDAQTGLQTVQVVGPRADLVFNDILNVGYLPVLHSKIAPMLQSQNRADVIRALGAVAFVHAGNPGKFYRDDLLRLAQHTDPEIREAAVRARANVPADQA